MNLYMAGSTFSELNDIMRQKNYNKLLSQINDRKCILEWVDYFRKHPECKSKLFIDSGAFSAHTKGVQLDVDEYIDFLNENEDAFTVYAQVDKIPGTFGIPYTREQLLEAPEKSWQNYLYMAPKLKNKDKLIPIFHQGEDFKWLNNMLEYTDENGNHIPYIGISTRNDAPMKDKRNWLELVFHTIATSSNPNVKTHAFGMTSFPLLESFPFTSADSTAWIMTSVNGSVFTPYGTILVSEKSIHNKGHFYNLSRPQQDAILKYIQDMGFTFEELSKDYRKREVFNITYMNNWANNYVYKGGNKVTNFLF